MKRFRFNPRTLACTKIARHVFFEDVLVSEVLGATYCLQAVAVHTGSLDRGHYTAFVRDSAAQWVLVNDEAPPVVVPFEMVSQAQAYMLLYKLVAA